MITNFETLISLQDDLDKNILFCIVNPEMCNPINKPTMRNGIIYFPSENYFRQWRLSKGNKGIVWLQELVDKNCKTCLGKGNTGTLIHQTEIEPEEIARKMNTFINDTPELVPTEIIKLLKLPPQFNHSLSILTGIITKEITDDKAQNYDVCLKYAKMIKQDFKLKKILWCESCFLPNYNKALEQARREIKFSIN